MYLGGSTKSVGKTFEWCPPGLGKKKTNEGIRSEKGVMLRFSLVLARTAYLPVMTMARTASLVMDSYRWRVISHVRYVTHS